MKVFEFEYWIPEPYTSEKGYVTIGGSIIIASDSKEKAEEYLQNNFFEMTKIKCVNNLPFTFKQILKDLEYKGNEEKIITYFRKF